jgi:LCP family protein required for cell wall assembly
MSTRDDDPAPGGESPQQSSGGDSTPDRPPTFADPQPTPADDPTERAPGWRRGDKKLRFFSRHRALVALVALVALLLAGCGGWLYYLNSQLGNVQRVDASPKGHRPPKTETGALNILLGGSDNGADGSSISEDVKNNTWVPGEHRSDTIMILHITEDHQHAYLISIPRDSYVDIVDENGKVRGKDKINAAFSLYGPAGYVATIEHLTGLRMDHLAIIDWHGFKDLTTALGGVTVYIPETFYDDSQKITWTKGYQNLEGKLALQYVRTRHGLPGGDFDRIKRQQNFLRELMKKTLSDGTMSNPIKLTNVLKAITSNLTVDDEFSSGEMRSLALSMRGLSSDDVTFLTAPWSGYGTTSDGQSIVELNKKECKALWKAIGSDNIQAYIDKYGGDTLGKAQNVN